MKSKYSTIEIVLDICMRIILICVALIFTASLVVLIHMEILEKPSYKYEVLPPDEITEELFDGKTIVVERCVGKVVNSSTGDGEILNTADAEHNYINYRGIKDFEISDGDVILSIFYYGNDADDIVDREDFLLCKGEEYDD